MKLVYSWLKEVVDIDVPASELADALTAAGLEVASVTAVHIPAKVKVARILETSRHPNADRLTVCKVDAGGPEPLTIVCGAPNTKPGMLSALAIEGAVLGPDFVVKKTKLRGVESFGMLCSERELGLSGDHAGIVTLPDDYTVGSELSHYYPDDAIFEIEITPQRGDCLSVVGVGREVAARYGLPLRETGERPAEKQDDPVSSAIVVTNDAPDLCPRYAGRLVRNVTIGQSPEWLRRRLALAGLRPINNVVDITNYLLIHYGQPMHAFDFDRIQGHSIIVRKAGAAAKFTTLDGTERQIISSDLLICDGSGPVALAGIMGGAGSEISASTRNVFFEGAFFSRSGIRKTAKRLGLSTDSSYRFERGVDPEKGLVDALDTAAALAVKIAGGTAAAGRIDLYPSPVVERVIAIRASRTSTVLGVPFSRDQITGFLSSLGIRCENESAEAVRCTVPAFRHDIAAEEDLIEEVGRVYGYDGIPPSQRAVVALQHQLPPAEIIADTIRYALAYAGFNEIMTNSLTSEARRALLTPDAGPVALLNPLSPDMAQMRTTLAGGMLEVVAYNHNRKNFNNRLFEIGKRYELFGGERIETDVLGIIVEGNWAVASWNTPAIPGDFYLVKGCLEALASHLRAGAAQLTPISKPSALFERDAAGVVVGTVHGIMGAVSQKIRNFFGIKTPVYYAELDITEYMQALPAVAQYRQLPKFPALERDFCFVMPDHLSAADISAEIACLSPLIESVRPFDLYRGEKLGAGVKSITFSVNFRSAERTLTDSEADGVSVGIISSMEKKFGVKLRT